MFEVELGNLDLQDAELNNFSVDSEYQDQLPPGPPVRGDYRARITKLTTRTNRDGEVILKDGKWPVLVVEEIEIIEGIANTPRRVAVYQDIRTKPFDRYGKKVSQLGDLLRAYDQNREFKGLAGQIAGLKELVQTSASFVFRGDWIAKDTEHAKARIAAAGGYDNLSREEINAIYNECEVRGMANFPTMTDPKTGDQVHLSQVEGPSGNTLEARFEMRRFYPSERAGVISLGAK
jgi:hypothetical protein